MDHPSVIFNTISRTFPSIRKWSNTEKNHLLDLIKKYLFDDEILLLKKLTDLTNKATSIIISGYQMSVEKNNIKTLEELENYITQTQKNQLQELLSKMGTSEKSTIEKLKVQLPSKCKVVELKSINGGTLEIFEQWMSNIFYKEKRC